MLKYLKLFLIEYLKKFSLVGKLIKAVIFDLDGTLVDLFDEHLKSFQYVIRKRLGKDFPREFLSRKYGMIGKRILADFLNEYKVKEKISYDDISEERREFFRNEIMKKKIRTLPGALPLMKKLKNNRVMMALATSNTKDMTDILIAASGLEGYFTVVVTRDDVRRGKPDPEMFLKAAGKLKVKPKECVVVEDSTHGVKAGKKAGMTVIAVTTGQHARRELLKEKPDVLVKSLGDKKLGEIFF